MRRGCFTRDFHKDIPAIIRMFALRSSGVSLYVLSTIFDRDRQTLRNQLIRHHIIPLSMEIRAAKGRGKKRLPRTPLPPTLSKKTFVNDPFSPKPPGKYDYLFDEMWENRSLGI